MPRKFHYANIAAIQTIIPKGWCVQDIAHLQAFAVNPVLRMMGCAGDDNRVRIWSLSDPAPVATLPYADHNLPSPAAHGAADPTVFPEPIRAMSWCSSFRCPQAASDETTSFSPPPVLVLGCRARVLVYVRGARASSTTP